MSRHFKIVVASYDCFPYLEASLQSVDNQKYKNFEVCVVDDCTPDPRQAEFIVDWCDKRDNWSYIIHDKENTGAMVSQVEALALLQPADDDVIVWVDGDDRLSSPGVLNFLNTTYIVREPLMTYGSYMPNPPDSGCAPAQPYPQECHDTRDYRNAHKWGIQFNHLRTVSGLLYNKLVPEVDFKFHDGSWFRVSADAAIMLPCLEMAGQDRIAVISQRLYVYSSDNPLSEWRKANKETLETHEHIFNIRKKDLV